MNLVLIGSRGSGKSAVAKALAQTLGWNAISTDAEVEHRSGCAIKELVEKSGWDAFRDLESAVVREIASRERCIVDTGGGAILRQENVDALRAHGRVFWLQAPVHVLAERIKDDTNRPSLTGAKSFVDELAEVLAARTPLYAAAAHHVILTDNKTPDAIAREIVELTRGD
jgi:shikimate kinase